MAIPLRHNDYGHFRVERGGRQHWALRATCYECKKSEDALLSGHKATLTQEWAERLFRGKSWEVGKDRQHDRCPTCIEAEKLARKAKQDVALSQLPPPPPPNDLVPIPPAAARPRDVAGKPMDWFPTPEEIAAYLTDREKALGLDPKQRRDILLWYPALTRGGEALIRDVVETRIAKNSKGNFCYEGVWDDSAVADLLNERVPALHATYNMIRQVRIQWFGSSRILYKKGDNRIAAKPAPAPAPTSAPTPTPAPLPTMVSMLAPQPAEAIKPAPGVLAFPKPHLAPRGPENENMTPVEKKLDLMEGDMLTLFADMEKLREKMAQDARDFATLYAAQAKRHDKIEDQLRSLGGKGGKVIEDYSITELLAEIARRTSTSQQVG